MYMIEKDVISQLVEEKLASSGNYLVDVVIKPGNLIIIEIDNDEGVCIDDCAELSRYVKVTWTVMWKTSNWKSVPQG